MLLGTLSYNGNPYIGVNFRCNDSVAIVPAGTPPNIAERVSEALGGDVVALSFSGSPLAGSLFAMNSSGLLVPEFVGMDEVAPLGRFVRVAKLPSRLNAAGNNILANDRAALVHPGIGKDGLRVVGDVLGVEVQPGTIAGVKTVGSAAVATNRGVLCHPKASRREIEFMKDLFKCDVEIGTANFGSPLVGACVTANSRGALAGSRTTGVEMGRIEGALGLIGD